MILHILQSPIACINSCGNTFPCYDKKKKKLSKLTLPTKHSSCHMFQFFTALILTKYDDSLILMFVMSGFCV